VTDNRDPETHSTLEGFVNHHQWPPNNIFLDGNKLQANSFPEKWTFEASYCNLSTPAHDFSFGHFWVISSTKTHKEQWAESLSSSNFFKLNEGANFSI
jgi:hypothetical protein